MTWIIVSVVLVALVVAVLVAMGRKRGGRFPRPPEGNVVGTWKFVADPERREVAWELALPDGVKGSFAVHFVQWQLFYFGNGSASMDGSQELRGALRALLGNTDDCPWQRAESVPRGAATLDMAGEFRDPGGFASFPGVLGVPRKAESLFGAALTVAQIALRDPGSAEQVRRGLERLLAWHEAEGPAPSLAQVGPRAFAALQPDAGP